MNASTSPFEAHADDYDRWFDSERGVPIFDAELDCIRQAILEAHGQWLEVGVGSGRFAQALGIKEGVDPSPAMARKAAERGIMVQIASGEALPYGNASFDGVLLICTICFLRDPTKALRECWRVLRNDGRLVIGFVPENSPWGLYHTTRGGRGHIFYASAHFYKSEEIRALAEDVGFTCLSERGCVLPKPIDFSICDETDRQGLRDESFVLFSFSKIQTDPGGQT